MRTRTRRGHVYRRRTTDGSWGRWHAVIDVAGRGQPRRQLTRSFSTQSQAYAWLHDQAAQQSASVSVAQYLTQWLSEQSHLAPSTRATCRGHIGKHLVPVLGHRELAALTTQDVRDLHATLASQGVSPGLSHRVHATLSSALTDAVHAGLLGRNPAVGVKLPRRDPYVAASWRLPQLRLFLRTADGDDLAALWRLAVITGLRRGELLGLRWRDLHLDEGVIRVRMTRTAVAGHVIEGPPKTTRSRRAVAVDDATVRMLRHQRVLAGEEALAAGRTVDGDAWVFTTSDGQPVTPELVSTRFRELVVEARLPVIRFHDLRHLCRRQVKTDHCAATEF